MWSTSFGQYLSYIALRCKLCCSLACSYVAISGALGAVPVPAGVEVGIRSGGLLAVRHSVGICVVLSPTDLGILASYPFSGEVPMM